MESQPEDQPGADVKIDLQSLKDFENAILKVLDDLTMGDVSVTDPVTGHLNSTDFGQNFTEAAGILFSSGFAIMKVRELAKMVHQQIEAMALTIKMAGDATAMADQANQARLSKMLYGEPGKEPFNAERTVPGAAAAPPASAPATSGTPASAATAGAPADTASTG